MTTTNCILMNFDDRVRIVHNANKQAVTLDIGAVKQAEIDQPTLDMLTHAMTKSDPLVIVPEGTERSPEMLSIMALLQDIGTGLYDEVLARSAAILGPESFGGTRPSRAELRFKLRTIAQGLAYGVIQSDAAVIKQTAAAVEKKRQEDERRQRTVQDDVDPDKLDEDLRRQREADQRKARDAIASDAARKKAEVKPTEQDRMDEALGIAVAPAAGGNTTALAAALAGKDGDADPDAFDPATAPKGRAGRQKAPSAKKAAKGAKKPAPKPTAKSGKRGTPAKKPVGRVKA